MTDDELEELREQTRGSDRIDADEDGASADSTTSTTDEAQEESGAEETSDIHAPDPADGFDERYAEVVGEVQRRERPRSFSASDPALSAFFEALSRDEDARQEVGDALAERAGADVDDGYTRSELVRLAVLAGVEEATPDYAEVVSDSFDR